MTTITITGNVTDLIGGRIKDGRFELRLLHPVMADPTLSTSVVVIPIQIDGRFEFTVEAGRVIELTPVKLPGLIAATYLTPDVDVTYGELWASHRVDPEDYEPVPEPELPTVVALAVSSAVAAAASADAAAAQAGIATAQAAAAGVAQAAAEAARDETVAVVDGPSSWSGAVSVDTATDHALERTLTGNVVITVTGTSGHREITDLLLKQDGTGSHTLTVVNGLTGFSAVVVLSTAPNALDFVELVWWRNKVLVLLGAQSLGIAASWVV